MNFHRNRHRRQLDRPPARKAEDDERTGRGGRPGEQRSGLWGLQRRGQCDGQGPSGIPRLYPWRGGENLKHLAAVTAVWCQIRNRFSLKF